MDRNIFLKLYRFLNLLSIDVVLGSVCSALFFSKVFGVSILPYGLLALALTVWIIYTVDRLLDARKVSRSPSTKRHQFHQRNARILIGFVFVAIGINCVLMYFIRKPVFLGGAYLIAGVGVYLFVQQYMKVFKEIVIAVLYTTGVALIPMTITTLTIEDWPWVLLVQFFLTALANLIMFSWFDHEHDLRDSYGSFVTAVGDKGSRYCIWIILLIAILLTAFSENTLASFFILLSDVVLLVIFKNESYFRHNDRFRLLGDAVFFIPFFYWII